MSNDLNNLRNFLFSVSGASNVEDAIKFFDKKTGDGDGILTKYEFGKAIKGFWSSIESKGWNGSCSNAEDLIDKFWASMDKDQSAHLIDGTMKKEYNALSSKEINALQNFFDKHYGNSSVDDLDWNDFKPEDETVDETEEPEDGNNNNNDIAYFVKIDRFEETSDGACFTLEIREENEKGKIVNWQELEYSHEVEVSSDNLPSGATLQRTQQDEITISGITTPGTHNINVIFKIDGDAVVNFYISITIDNSADDIDWSRDVEVTEDIDIDTSGLRTIFDLYKDKKTSYLLAESLRICGQNDRYVQSSSRDHLYNFGIKILDEYKEEFIKGIITELIPYGYDKDDLYKKLSFLFEEFKGDIVNSVIYENAATYTEYEFDILQLKDSLEIQFKELLQTRKFIKDEILVDDDDDIDDSPKETLSMSDLDHVTLNSSYMRNIFNSGQIQATRNDDGISEYLNTAFSGLAEFKKAYSSTASESSLRIFGGTVKVGEFEGKVKGNVQCLFHNMREIFKFVPGAQREALDSAYETMWKRVWSNVYNSQVSGAIKDATYGSHPKETINRTITISSSFHQLVDEFLEAYKDAYK